jgi:hypothetical protein
MQVCYQMCEYQAGILRPKELHTLVSRLREIRAQCAKSVV